MRRLASRSVGTVGWLTIASACNGQSIAANPRLPAYLRDPVGWAQRRNLPQIMQAASIQLREPTIGGDRLSLYAIGHEGALVRQAVAKPDGTLADVMDPESIGWIVAMLLALPLPLLFRLRHMQNDPDADTARMDALRRRIEAAHVHNVPNRIALGAFDDRKI